MLAGKNREVARENQHDKDKKSLNEPRHVISSNVAF